MKKPIRSVLLSVLILAGLALFGFISLAQLMGQKGPAEKTIWTGQSGGFVIHWTTSDIRAQSSGKAGQVLFSVIPLAQRGFEDFSATMKDPDAGAEDCLYERNFRILSVVGSIVSFEDVYDSFCRGWAYPSAETRFTAIDLAKPGEIAYTNTGGFPPIDVDLSKLGKVVKLTDFFSEDEILKALLADSVIKKALPNSGASQPPQTLHELYQLLKKQSLEIGECVYRFPEDFLTRFAFHHLEKGQVAVRIGLPPNSEPCRALYAQLGILLPIPESLKTPLALAASGKEGFLMRAWKEISGNQTTTVAFTMGKFGQD